MSVPRIWLPAAGIALLVVLVGRLTIDPETSGDFEGSEAVDTKSSIDTRSVELDAGAVGAPSLESVVVESAARRDPATQGDPSASGSAPQQTITIGEDLDPDDPRSWPGYTESISIGEDLDPEDSSTWPSTTGSISVGEDLDPEDPSTWPAGESVEAIDIGEELDPGDPSTWPSEQSAEAIQIGEERDPW